MGKFTITNRYVVATIFAENAANVQSRSLGKALSNEGFDETIIENN